MTTSDQQRTAEHALSTFEALLRAGDYRRVDELLESRPGEADTEAEIVAILSITFHGKEELRQRAAFVDRARTFLADRLGDKRARALMEHRS